VTNPFNKNRFVGRIRASAVRDSEKYSIIIYRKSTTSFPTS